MTGENTKGALAEYLRIIFQRKWLIVGISLLSIGGAVSYAYCFATRLYRYRHVVYIRRKAMAEALSTADPIRKRTYDMLELLTRPEKGESELLRKANALARQEGLEAMDEAALRDELDQLGKRLRIVDFRASGFVVQYDCANPHVAKEVVELTIDYYRRESSQEIQKALDEAERILEPQLEKYKKRVEIAYQRLRGVTPRDIEEYYVASPVGGTGGVGRGRPFSVPGEVTTQYLTLLSVQGEVEMSLKAVEEKVAHLERVVGRPKTPQPKDRIRFEPTEEYLAARAQLRERERELAQLRERWTDRHPNVVKLRSEVDVLRARMGEVPETREVRERVRQAQTPARLQEMLAEAKAERAGLIAKGKRLQRILEEKRELLKKLGSHHLKVVEAQQEYQMAKQRLLDFQAKLESLKLTEYSEIMQKATQLLPSEYVADKAHLISPNRPLVVLMGVLIAIFLSGSAVFAAEYADHSMNTIDDLRQTMPGIQVLGQLSHFKSQKKDVFYRKRKTFLARRFLVFTVKAWLILAVAVIAAVAGYYYYTNHADEVNAWFGRGDRSPDVSRQGSQSATRPADPRGGPTD